MNLSGNDSGQCASCVWGSEQRTPGVSRRGWLAPLRLAIALCCSQERARVPTAALRPHQFDRVAPGTHHRGWRGARRAQGRDPAIGGATAARAGQLQPAMRAAAGARTAPRRTHRADSNMLPRCSCGAPCSSGLSFFHTLIHTAARLASPSCLVAVCQDGARFTGGVAGSEAYGQRRAHVRGGPIGGQLTGGCGALASTGWACGHRQAAGLGRKQGGWEALGERRERERVHTRKGGRLRANCRNQTQNVIRGARRPDDKRQVQRRGKGAVSEKQMRELGARGRSSGSRGMHRRGGGSEHTAGKKVYSAAAGGSHKRSSGRAAGWVRRLGGRGGRQGALAQRNGRRCNLSAKQLGQPCTVWGSAAAHAACKRAPCTRAATSGEQQAALEQPGREMLHHRLHLAGMLLPAASQLHLAA